MTSAASTTTPMPSVRPSASASPGAACRSLRCSRVRCSDGADFGIHPGRRDDDGAGPPRHVRPLCQAIDSRSASGASAATGSVDFETGALSPVSAESSTSRELTSTMRPSAGTTSPQSVRRRRPGRRSVASTSTDRPSRRTVAVGAVSSPAAIQRLSSAR